MDLTQYDPDCWFDNCLVHAAPPFWRYSTALMPAAVERKSSFLWRITMASHNVIERPFTKPIRLSVDLSSRFVLARLSSASGAATEWSILFWACAAFSRPVYQPQNPEQLYRIGVERSRDRNKFDYVDPTFAAHGCEGNPLRIDALSTKLAKVSAYRRTICAVEAQDYLLRRINGLEEPIVSKSAVARNALLDVLTEALKSLHWKDFETLIDIIFPRSGWHRVSALGGSQKAADLEIEQATTEERAAVQVKSNASQRLSRNISGGWTTPRGSTVSSLYAIQPMVFSPLPRDVTMSTFGSGEVSRRPS
jgi:hypothetical protein